MSKNSENMSATTIADTLPRDTTARKVGGVIIPSKTWVPFLAGAIGGMSGACLTAPLDVVKTRLQSDFYKERIEAAKRAGTVKRGVWQHFVETGVIVRYVTRGLRLI